MNEHVQSATNAPLFNPLAPEFIRDPYPHYERLRNTDPMHLTPLGMYVASRHAEASLVLRDKRFGKDFVERSTRRYGPKIMEEPVFRSMSHWMLQAGTRPTIPACRGLVVKAFTARRGRGHAAAHPAGRRSNARSRCPARAHGPDRGFCVPPAGHDHLRYARDPGGTPRDILLQFPRWAGACSIRCR